MNPHIYHATPLKDLQEIRLNEKTSHHLAHVLRLRVGDSLTLFDGNGGEHVAMIKSMDKKGVMVQLKAFNDRIAESALHLHLVQSLLRREKMDLIIQKSVELGVHKITPILTERCNVKLHDTREKSRMSHWQSIMIAACEQSKRLSVPELSPVRSFNEWLMNDNLGGEKFVLSPHATETLKEYPLATSKMPPIVILIGPEGGFSDQEMHRLLQSNYRPLYLGPRILRTETAAIAAITVFQSYYGDMT